MIPAERSVPRVLSIAGSDPSGGAGIQADLKSIAANGGYGMAAITALTAQNTRGVTGVHVPPPGFLRAQLDAIADDIVIDAVKIGMLGTVAVIDEVAAWLGEHPVPIVVLDPVMIATSGDRLLDADAEDALRRMLPRADAVTPNIPELAVLAGEERAGDWAGALAQAQRVAARDGVVVIVKGGHLQADEAPDAVVTADGVLVDVAGERIATSSTHGTGCSLSSALATRFAATGDWGVALRESKRWLQEAIGAGAALAVGQGHGPVDHFAALRTVEPTHATASPRLQVEPREPGSCDAGSWAAGDFTAAAWERSRGIRDAIGDVWFVRDLASGDLPPVAFTHYLAQDALYLRDYARVLARASALAPTRQAQAFWADAAHGSLVAELDLHTSWLGGEPDVPASATCRAYLDHLVSCADRYDTVVAALLPCFWIYVDLGTRLAPRATTAHPYRDWLLTYGAPEFVASTRTAIGLVDEVARTADAGARARMAAAFDEAAAFEYAFFAQRAGDSTVHLPPAAVHAG
ncbi:bifunctional hydroxymethylpyrimidine kinase/phosphomethylpyrimidine kinase [Microbacterium xanthum]|uniref:bifunctional hydroxymethylpyrimidine kinase/phosphomethylpyrimidine kinase n=1 Tax=Microbacterium xanthum TaxID=3079794 RepID=UPI002AD5133F|nr:MULTISPECIES: bifunctional hydroxymethylpyrimidine kinase/phosphomethylpyrimidine kinase [unclassified Microbacterium]MDZ8172254.1 bifunctional hydroxymethylpyrimidine kinase/phosphomethylpyrimidine kinase [Microbacterium sp. KSW-48]MDZ8202028.1 bifunctional hydroxymethylpyrimidine kinase/phosphomethylpyrimidine kinase [Microbacterium sp. SSW1-59]